MQVAVQLLLPCSCSKTTASSTSSSTSSTSTTISCLTRWSGSQLRYCCAPRLPPRCRVRPRLRLPDGLFRRCYAPRLHLRFRAWFRLRLQVGLGLQDALHGVSVNAGLFDFTGFPHCARGTTSRTTTAGPASTSTTCSSGSTGIPHFGRALRSWKWNLQVLHYDGA